MLFRTDAKVIEAIKHELIPWNDERAPATFLEWVGDARFVLIGEATHGTHEFYSERARLTRLLIEERGFSAVAIEGDWPHAHEVHRFLQNPVDNRSVAQVLAGFARFPTWMWRNTVVAEFATWLQRRNARLPEGNRVGFYGLDLYSLHGSIRAVVEYLDTVEPALGRAARRSYSCFEHYGQDPEAYAWAAGRLGQATCEDAVVEQLLRLRQQEASLVQGEGIPAEDAFFSAEQNARLARNAERYYRCMVRGRVESWNLRDQHMAETLQEITSYLARRRPDPRIVVWAHNSHLGDARATELGRSGELNLGQLVREQYEGNSRLLGLTTSTGSVLAASDWGAAPARKQVRAPLSDSYEFLFQSAGVRDFFLRLNAGTEAAAALRDERLERAIGVIYRPETERYSHYFQACLPAQFDAILHLDQTRALEPLDEESREDEEEFPETYPSGV